MKRVTVKLRDACHKAMAMFCIDNDISHQEFYVKAQALYLQKYCDVTALPYCNECQSINTAPNASFNYHLK